MLTEDDVVKAVAAHLKSEGYCVESTCSTGERGVDIVAIHSATNRRLLVEAKGGTSSKSTTARYGSPFTPNQAKSHVSVAFYYAAKLRQRHSAEGAEIAMAFPDDPQHRMLVDDITSALDTLGISVFFVDAAHRVVLGEPA